MAELGTTSLISDANLTHYYRFEGNSNDSKGANNGTDTDISYSSANGKFGQGAGFNSTTSKIAIGAKILPVGAKSISCWFKSASTTNFHTIINENDISSAKSGTGIYTAITSGVMRFIVTYASGGNFLVNLTGLVNVCDGNLHHIVCTWDGSTTANKAKIYVDNTLDVQGTATNTESNTPSDNCMIGRGSTTADYYLNGATDDLAVFSRELTAAEINTLFVAGSSSFFIMF